VSDGDCVAGVGNRTAYAVTLPAADSERLREPQEAQSRERWGLIWPRRVGLPVPHARRDVSWRFALRLTALGVDGVWCKPTGREAAGTSRWM